MLRAPFKSRPLRERSPAVPPTRPTPDLISKSDTPSLPIRRRKEFRTSKHPRPSANISALMRARRLLFLALALMLIQAKGQDASSPRSEVQPNAGEPAASIPTRGLIHWWPDPVEGADRVTGRKGIRRGFGALDEFPEVRLGYAPGWVELGPGITNRTFTLTGWLMEASRQTTPSMHTVISQDSGLEDGWVVRRFPSQVEFVSQSSAFLGQGARASMPVGWHFIAVRVDRGRSDLWLDGTAWVRSLSDSPDSGSPGPLCIGNNALGNSPWDGDIRDLRIFDRLLTDSEIVTLSRLPRSEPTQAPTASLRVAGQAVSVAPGRLGRYEIQKFTSDDSLPGANIQTLFQERNGALWVGSEHGLSRFDGRFFKPQDSVNAAFFATGSNVRAIAEDTIGNLWFGLFDGIVQREQQHWRAYTNIGSARLIRCMAPAPDGTVWFAGNRHPAPRGRAQLRRLDPETGRLLVDTMVPGQVRDLRPAPGGLWIATDEPAGLWHFRETTGALEPLVHIAAVESVPHSSRFPFKPLARMATSARTNSIQVEVFQDQEGESQWAMVRIGTKGPL